VISPENMPQLTMTQTDERVTIEGVGFRVVFDKAQGVIIEYVAGDQYLIKTGPMENYYRAPTDIDLLMGNPPANVHKWREAGLDRLVREVVAFESVQVSPQVVQVRVGAFLCAEGKAEGVESEILYQVYGNGEVALANKVLISEGLPFVPRVGLELTLPRELDQLMWYGRGPHENYVDRKVGAAVGQYTSTVAEQFTPYVYPSECGGKEDVRWLTLTDQDGTGLMVIAREKLHIDALHYTIQDLAAAAHPYELTPRDAVIVHLDGWHMGVGGDNGWTSQVHEEFLIYPGEYRCGLRLKPITGRQDPSVLGRQTICDA
jgi:beta-galactosidase